MTTKQTGADARRIERHIGTVRYSCGLCSPSRPCAACIEATKRANGADAELREVLQRCLSFLADLNGSKWIAGDDAGSVDMRQRAKALQRLAYMALSSPNSETLVGPSGGPYVRQPSTDTGAK